MSKLPVLSASEAIAAFQKAGFAVVRTTGSHHIMKREGWRFLLSVPFHAGQDLKPGTLRGLIRAAGMTIDDFAKLLG